MEVLPAPKVASSYTVLASVPGMMLHGHSSAWALLFCVPLSSTPVSQSPYKGSEGAAPAVKGLTPARLGAATRQGSPVRRQTLSQACSSRLAPAPAAHGLWHQRQPWACTAPAEGAPALLSAFVWPAQLWLSKLLLAAIKQIEFASASSTESCWRKGGIRNNMAIEADGACHPPSTQTWPSVLADAQPRAVLGRGLRPDAGHREGSVVQPPQGYRGKGRAELGEEIVNAPLLPILRDKSSPRPGAQINRLSVA